MAKIENIRGIVVGDDCYLSTPTDGLVSGESATKAWFTIKKLITDTYTNAKLKKVITTTFSATDGHITNPYNAGTAEMYFNLDKASTKLLDADYPYEYDVQILLNNGRIETGLRGKIYFTSQVTEVES